MFAAAAADEARFNTPLPFFKRAGDNNFFEILFLYNDHILSFESLHQIFSKI